MTDLPPIKTRSKGRTQATGVKTVLIDALVASNRNYLKAYGSKQHRETRSLIANYRGTFYGEGRIEVDQAAQAITDHFLDREKVRAALIATFEDCRVIKGRIAPPETEPYEVDAAWIADHVTDRLIASLAGGSQ
jgi:hypothetical protein